MPEKNFNNTMRYGLEWFWGGICLSHLLSNCSLHFKNVSLPLPSSCKADGYLAPYLHLDSVMAKDQANIQTIFN